MAAPPWPGFGGQPYSPQGGQSGFTQPYSSGPGIQPGATQGQFQGVDFTQRGAGEQYYANNAHAYQTPSFGEQNAQHTVEQFGNGRNPSGSRLSQAYFKQFQQAMPNIAQEPGFGAYFDNAKNRAAESINQAMAARGAYGSSAANDQTARAFTDLEGQRALKEADYNLQRLGEQRAYLGLGGQLAGQVDSNQLALAQNDLNWQQMLGNLGLQSSQLGLQRTNSGQDAANSAQAAERARGQDYFQNQLALGDRMAQLMSQSYYPGLDNDAALLQSVQGGQLGAADAALGQDYRSQQEFWNTLQNGMGAYAAGKSILGGQ